MRAKAGSPKGKQSSKPRRQGGRRRASGTKAKPKPKPGDITSLAAALAIEFRRPELLRLAITHKSAEQELGLPSNERLEFLGDAVLGLVVAEHLYRSHPDLDEGALTKVKEAR